MYRSFLLLKVDSTSNSDKIIINSREKRLKKNYKLNKSTLLAIFNWKIYFRLFFNSLIKRGLKKRLLKFFNHLLSLIKLNNSFSVKIYLAQVFFNLKPILASKFLYKSKYLRIPIPWHYFSRFWKSKYTTLAVSWLKKSIKERSEKTLILRIYSEFESIRLNKGRTIEKKKNFYFSLKKTKAYKNFYRYIKEKC